MDVSYSIERAGELAKSAVGVARDLPLSQFRAWFVAWHGGTRDEAMVILSFALAIAMHECGIAVTGSILVLFTDYRSGKM